VVGWENEKGEGNMSIKQMIRKLQIRLCKHNWDIEEYKPIRNNLTEAQKSTDERFPYKRTCSKCKCRQMYWNPEESIKQWVLMQEGAYGHEKF
jgi:hypothetical protein